MADGATVLRPAEGAFNFSLSVSVMVGVAALLGWLAHDWIAAAGIAVLWLAWRYLPRGDGPPVLALAFTFQWLQVTSGVYYYAITHRELPAIIGSDYRTMVEIGLGCLVALGAGLVLAGRTWRPVESGRSHPEIAFSTAQLVALYLLFTVIEGPLQSLAWNVPLLTQGFLAIGMLRLALLFLIFRRLAMPRLRVGFLLLLLAGEIVLGASGYFAGFREPIMMLALVLLESLDFRRLRSWLLISGLAGGAFFAGLLWLGIRTTYRADFELEAFATSRSARLERLASLSRGWLGSDNEQLLGDLDNYVDRLWAIYYPALAVSRVPDVLPYENGNILWGAVRHVLMPRLFFPDKAVLPSDSEMVRKYSGAWVAGTDEDTSIAFGYAAESYVDFGIPVMFLPVLVYGLLMGLAFRFCLRIIWHRELAIGMVTVVFWLSLYLFERSWIKTLGFSLTLLIFCGGAVLVLDRIVMSRRTRWRRLRGLQQTARTPQPGAAGGPAIALPGGGRS
jgi:hypothetical protein